jgi:DHA1 family bicyclomycin/chloramphenicol resistance-like MFS transporter
MFAAGMTVAALAWLGVGHWAAVVLPYFLFLVGTALIVPNATAAALSPFPASAGAAASLMGAAGFTIGALVSAALGFAFDGTARPMASVAAAAGLAAFIVNQTWKASTR